jgi:CheY-like chemotaxis protein
MTNAITNRNPIVLIVEDEPIIRMNAADFLTDFGIDPVEAETATRRGALHLSEQAGHRRGLYRRQHARKHGRP